MEDREKKIAKPNVQLANVSKKSKVRHRTAINRTLASLPLGARRILFMALVQLDPKKMMQDGQSFRIYASEYAKIANIKINTAYEQLSEAADELDAQRIKIPKSELLPPIRRLPSDWKKPIGNGKRSLHITEHCDYEPGEGYVDIVFSAGMEPYICNFRNEIAPNIDQKKMKALYTSQVFLSAVRLKETNAAALYQLIRQKITHEQKKHYFDIGVDELKEELNLYKLEKGNKIYSYPIFKEFNRTVIKGCTDTIMKITELKNIKVEIIKKEKRKAKTLRFSYSIDNDHSFEGFNNDDKKTTD